MVAMPDAVSVAYLRKKWTELTRPFVWAKAFSQEYSSSQFGENCIQKLTMLIFTHCPLIVQQKSLVQASLTARTFNNKSFIFILRQCKGIAQIDMDFVYLGASLTLS